MSEPRIVIRAASIDEIVDLRWKILRAGLPRDAANFPGDDEPTTLHVGAFLDDRQIVGCAMLVRRPWQDEPAWQLRGMAVRDDLRGQGIGTRILEFAERTLAGQNYAAQLWCNARTPATSFYERLGWQKIGEEFHIESAGPHFKM